MKIKETFILCGLRREVNKRILEYTLLEDSAGYIYYYNGKCKDFGKLTPKKVIKIVNNYKKNRCLLMFNEFDTKNIFSFDYDSEELKLKYKDLENRYYRMTAKNANQYTILHKKKNKRITFLKQMVKKLNKKLTCKTSECEEMEIAIKIKDQRIEDYRNALDNKTKQLNRYKEAFNEIKKYFKSKDKTRTSLFNIYYIEEEINKIINKTKGQNR